MLTIALALFAGLVGGMISCEFFTGQTVFAEKAMDTFTHVTAERLQIVDENGTVRATLGVGLDGGVRFSMLDENHVPRITMKAAKDTGSLSLWDGEGSLRIQLKAPFSSLTFYEDSNKTVWSAP